jgi:hypothetical protein
MNLDVYGLCKIDLDGVGSLACSSVISRRGNAVIYRKKRSSKVPIITS